MTVARRERVTRVCKFKGQVALLLLVMVVVLRGCSDEQALAVGNRSERSADL